jgi:uncharacterized repeat protein (TIGR01451 family)
VTSSVTNSVRRSVTEKTEEKAARCYCNRTRAAFLAAAVLAIAGFVSQFTGAAHAAQGSEPQLAAHIATHEASSSKSQPPSQPQPKPKVQPQALRRSASSPLSLPLFFEPNQGQTAPQVKFLARGVGYGLFLTADEAVLQLRTSVASARPSASGAQQASSSVIRMHLEGANSSALVSGTSPLPGKSSYFIGNDPSKWQRDIPQFARVEYQSVYPGVDLVYYGDQGQLEYDFRVAPGAEPNHIALSFNGASAHIDSGNSGDLILSTDHGDVRFRAPRIYQPAAAQSRNALGYTEKTIAGSFRQLAGNRIGFTIGAYDHTRELVIDPTLTYSTFLGGSNNEGLVKVAVDSALAIYLVGSTNSADFPVTNGSTLTGTQNLFISKINPLNYGTGTSQLAYSIYLGGSGTDSPAGIAVDSNFSIYVAGSTTSPDFPTTTTNAFQPGPQTGTHGFLTKITATPDIITVPPTLIYNVTYSTYLAGNGADSVTGIAIDATNQNAYVTGDTTSTNGPGNGFPANDLGYQTASNSPGYPQFFASQINTSGIGFSSMLYSTYFGGGNPAGATAVGGGIAVDPTPSNVNMYITGATNMLPSVGAGGQLAFPLLDAWQSCLNQSGITGSCAPESTNNTDAFVAKFNPAQNGVNSLVYSTYLGGSGTDAGLAIAVDASSNTYITGSTNSPDWIGCAGFQCTYLGNQNGGANSNAFISKLGPLSGTTYPQVYFTWLGGSGPDSGQAIAVDSQGGAHVVGDTASPNLLVTNDAFQSQYAGQGDAFVALISTSLTGGAVGDYLSYLGGSKADQGTGVALDIYNATYVAGSTMSSNFPVLPTAYQLTLNGNGTTADAFVSKIGAVSALAMTYTSASPSPNPVPAGAEGTFTFNITNNGPDNATNIVFSAVVPTGTQVAKPSQALVSSGTGNCTGVEQNTISCFIPALAACSTPPTCTSPSAQVQVNVFPSDTNNVQQVSVSALASANGSSTTVSSNQIANVVDFGISASPTNSPVTAGNPAYIQVLFCPLNNQSYSATITPSQSALPSIVTASTPTFNPTSVMLTGSACGSTTLSIATVARPVTQGSLLRRGSFFAAWLPIGGLSLVGLGVGVSRRRRRWLIGAVLGLIMGVIVLQSACGSASSSATTTGGTQAGQYTFTITGSASTGASHQAQAKITVN